MTFKQTHGNGVVVLVVVYYYYQPVKLLLNPLAEMADTVGKLLKTVDKLLDIEIPSIG